MTKTAIISYDNNDKAVMKIIDGLKSICVSPLNRQRNIKTFLRE